MFYFSRPSSHPNQKSSIIETMIYIVMLVCELVIGAWRTTVGASDCVPQSFVADRIDREGKLHWALKPCQMS